MWKTVNSVYKSANNNIKKLSKNIPNIKKVSQTIQNIKIQKIISNIPSITKKQLSQVQTAINPVFKNKKPVMPVNKMSKISQMSYQNQKFQEICDLLFQKLRVFKYQAKSAKQTLNALILLSYLIKNAASGFIDQFRQQISIFEEHSQLNILNAYTSDQKQLSKLKSLLVEIRQRAKYITVLLTDKKKLLKQKQIAMQIKRKIIEGQGKLSSQGQQFYRDQGGNQIDKKQYMQKVQSFLQHYVWKYWNKFDQKMENITQRIIQKIDQYLDMEQPESFQIEQIQITEDHQSLEIKSQTDIKQSIKQIKYKQQVFLREKNQSMGIDIQMENGPVLDTELV